MEMNLVFRHLRSLFIDGVRHTADAARYRRQSMLV